MSASSSIIVGFGFATDFGCMYLLSCHQTETHYPREQAINFGAHNNGHFGPNLWRVLRNLHKQRPSFPSTHFPRYHDW
jgi:hypothetical protein